jgi:hypothetical protein
VTIESGSKAISFEIGGDEGGKHLATGIFLIPAELGSVLLQVAVPVHKRLTAQLGY